MAKPIADMRAAWAGSGPGWADFIDYHCYALPSVALCALHTGAHVRSFRNFGRRIACRSRLTRLPHGRISGRRGIGIAQGRIGRIAWRRLDRIASLRGILMRRLFRLAGLLARHA